MDILDRVKKHFNDSVQIKTQIQDELALPVANAATLIAQGLLEGHKLLACGNGGSGALAQHFVGYMLNGFGIERPGLPAYALSADALSVTAIADDYHFSDVYAKQIRTLGDAGDILLGLSLHGNSTNILRAMEAAHDRGMRIIALTGHEGGQISTLLHSDDIELRVSSQISTRIYEIHLLLLHCLCDLIDHQLFPVHEGE